MASLDSKSYPNSVSAEVDPTHAAARVSIRPLETSPPITGDVLGHYRMFVQGAVSFGTSGNNLTGAIRWTDPNNLAVIYRFYIGSTTISGSLNVYPAGSVIYARGYTSPETTNATTVTPDQNAQFVRRGMGPTAMQFQIATAGSGMSGGVRTNDPGIMGLAGMNSINASTGAQGGSALGNTNLLAWDTLGGHPIVLGFNTGLLWYQAREQNSFFPCFGVDWAEVASF
jgi:hypothetical protein